MQKKLKNAINTLRCNMPASKGLAFLYQKGETRKILIKDELIYTLPNYAI